MNMVGIGCSRKFSGKLLTLSQAMSQPDFHRAYLTAARRLFDGFTGKGEDALPIFFLQRHVLELLIKNCLRIIYKLMLVECELGRRSEPPCECRLDRVTRDHSLHALSGDLKDALFLDNDSVSLAMLRLESLVAKMHSVDPDSTWSRFLKVDKRTCETKPIHPAVLDIRFYQQEIEEVSKLLVGEDVSFRDALLYKYHLVWEACMNDLKDSDES